MGQRLTRLDKYVAQRWHISQNVGYYESLKPNINKLKISKHIFKSLFLTGMITIAIPYALAESRKRYGYGVAREDIDQAKIVLKDAHEMARAAFIPEPVEKGVFVPIAENLWQIRKWGRNMIVYKSPKTGGLILHSPIPLNEEELDQLSEIGEIIELIVQPKHTYTSLMFLHWYGKKFPNTKIIIPEEADDYYLYTTTFFSASCEKVFSPNNQYDIKLHKTGIKGANSQYIYDVPLDDSGKKRGLIADDGLKTPRPTVAIEPQPYIPFSRKYFSSLFQPSSIQQSLLDISKKVEESGNRYEVVAFTKGEPITENISLKLKKASEDDFLQKVQKWISSKNSPHEETSIETKK
eukprot:TRINITY_DN339_c0_g1_i4.p1 TRINITY_DN339_c0_g1~~TRINITY_DN339_c0_g1_i4.p1  ORF type:complete len:351 (+),score=54.06 TRINITY_DN339_c0_g1_i4:192-1244(+)